MLLSQMLKHFRASIGVALVVTAGLMVPSASADTCTLTATLLNGQTVTFTVSAPPGTPPIDMLPPGTPPVQSITANCYPTPTPAGTAATASGTGATTTTSQKSTTHSSSTTHTTTTPKHSSSANSTTTDHKTTSASSGLTHQHPKATKARTATHAAAKTKLKKHHAGRTRRSTHRQDPARRRSLRPDRPRHQPVAAPPANPQSTTAAVNAAFRQPTPDPVREQASGSIPWLFVLALVVLAVSVVGAAKETGLIRSRD